MKKRDYRPYCFDSCNKPLKTRHQQLLDAIHNIKIPEVKAKVDEKQLNDAVSKAIKENPVKVEVEVDDKVIVESIQKDLCKVHSHITRAENEIIETLSINCDGGCGCGGHDCNCGDSDCKCGNKKECNCQPSQLTKEDLIEAVNRVNSHTDRAIETIEVPTVSEIKETVQKVVAVVDAKVETLAEKTEEYFGEVESMVEEVKADVKEIKEKVEETETKVDDFRALYASYHD